MLFKVQFAVVVFFKLLYTATPLDLQHSEKLVPTAQTVLEGEDIDFFDSTSDPVFKNHEGTTFFEENRIGLTYQVESATWGPDLDLPVYYLLNEGDCTLFDLNTSTGMVTLLRELDYEERTSYDLVIQSSSSLALHLNAAEATKFHLTVEVVDVNDNPPVFNSKSYVATLTSPFVLQVMATDVDSTSQGQLRFRIKSLLGSSDVLSQIQNPFVVDNSGYITSNFSPKNGQEGYFTLTVIVQDESEADDHTDEAEVQINLITSESTVKFTFENERETVVDAKDKIKNVLDSAFAQYNYVSSVEEAEADEPVDEYPRSVVPVLFFDETSNIPVDSAAIYKQVADAPFFRLLKTEFLKLGLLLVSFDSKTTPPKNTGPIYYISIIANNSTIVFET